MWKGDEYYYGVGILKSIAENYKDIYEGILFVSGHTMLNPWSIAEFKGDFDTSLNAIGKGHWTGDIEGKEFDDFKRFGRLQRIVIADFYDIQEGELERLGFYQISRVKGLAYKWMANHLNGIPFRGSQTRFVAKTLDTV